MHGVDYVVHAAALKQVDTGGVQPVRVRQDQRRSARRTSSRPRIDAGVKKVVALSTDKASSPINLYGATKLTADKLFITGNHYAAAVRHPLRAWCATATSWAAAARSSRSSARWPRRASRCRSPTCADPVLDHAAAGRAVRGRLLRPDAGRRALRAADPVDEGHRPGAGDRARRRDARHRHAPRREAARGDDQPRRRAAARIVLGRHVLRAPAGPRAPGATQPPADGEPGRRRLRLPLRQQRPVVLARRRDRAQILEAGSERAPLRTPVDRRGRHRGRRRGAARRLADHRARRSTRSRRALSEADRRPPRCVSCDVRARPRCTSRTPRPASAPATRSSPPR